MLGFNYTENGIIDSFTFTQKYLTSIPDGLLSSNGRDLMLKAMEDNFVCIEESSPYKEIYEALKSDIKLVKYHNKFTNLDYAPVVTFEENPTTKQVDIVIRVASDEIHDEMDISNTSVYIITYHEFGFCIQLRHDDLTLSYTFECEEVLVCNLEEHCIRMVSVSENLVSREVFLMKPTTCDIHFKNIFDTKRKHALEPNAHKLLHQLANTPFIIMNNELFNHACKNGDMGLVDNFTRNHPDKDITGGILIAKENGHQNIVDFLNKIISPSRT